LPIQPLLKSGCEPWGMWDHIKRYPWVLEIHEYSRRHELLRSLKGELIPEIERIVVDQKRRQSLYEEKI